MKRAWIPAVLAAGVTVFAAAGPVAAQTNTGTSFGSFLLIEPGARVSGMGNAGGALLGGLQSVYYNPAAAAELRTRALEFTACGWLADISYRYAAAALPLDRFSAVYGSVTALNSGDIEVRTVEKPLGTGELYAVTDVAISLGYGRRISDRFSAGFAVNYVQETIWNSSASTVTLSLGTLYRVSEHGLHVGASVTNYGTNARFGGRDLRIVYPQDPAQHGNNNILPGEVFTDKFSVPVLFRVGLGLPLELGRDLGLNLAADAYHPSDNDESLSLGGELLYRKSLAVRAGYQNLFLEDSETGLTAGAGVQGGLGEGKYHVDYAWADHGRLGSTSRLTLGVTF
ncbi:MAG: PorV/PorQ family protein [Candidatus Eisenbacteria bacterium]|nr:PorV/PorQ family protein [Candidatus Eisenbacteria bacterium]